MKPFCQTIFFVFLFTQFAFSQSENTVRKQNFDEDWKFCLGDISAASDNTFNDDNWRKIDLPHDWSIEGTVNPDNPTKGAGGYFPTGIGWYRKIFQAPAEWKEKNISIYFEGIYMNAEVFINGKSLGIHHYGYTSFTYNLSPYLEFGKENIIAVKVDNSQQINSRWYSGSGIYRHVWMMVTNPVHIAQWGVAVTTSNVNDTIAAISIKTKVIGRPMIGMAFNIKYIVYDTVGKIVAEKETLDGVIYPYPERLKRGISIEVKNKYNADWTNEFQRRANEVIEYKEWLNIENPHLWNLNNPYQYKLVTQIMDGEKIIDETVTKFGIRTINFSVENGFQLNGKTIKISGGCVHHDNGCLGSAAYDRAEERKVELLKSAGFNAVRTSHNPPSEAFLNACDKMGLLVMDESFDCWKWGKNKNDYSKYFQKWWKEDLETMILRDRNHPSIVMWSIGNEIVERGTSQAIKTADTLAKTVKNIDATRPVTSAVVENGKDWTIMDSLFAVQDIAGYNYHLHAAPDDHKRVPSRVIVQTESYPKDAFKNWKLVQENNFVIGDFVWTAIDYLGEAGIGRNYYSGETPGENWDNDMFPWHGSYCGDIDLIGTRKPISHYRSMLYNNNEKLYMAVREPNPEPLKIKETWWSVYPSWESWNWQGFEGKELQVEVYSKYPKVRLYLNDKLIGEKNVSQEQEFKATFPVAYSAGILKAVGVENDKEVETKILQTAGEPAKIKLTADRKELLAKGQDLCFVEIEITDKDGTLQPNAVNRLQFNIEGVGSIIGVANADMKDWDSYVANTRKAWHGKALVVIKTNHQPGEIKLTASSNGLEKGNIIIKSIQKN